MKHVKNSPSRPLRILDSRCGRIVPDGNAIGCGRQGNVSGKVLYQNKPLVFGRILVEGSDGTARHGNIEKDGTFYVDGVATGEARVAVNSLNPKSIQLLTKNPNMKREGRTRSTLS
jgi:hypothetical protein